MKLNYFNFKYFGDDVLLTNDMGRYVYLPMNEFKKLLSNRSGLKAEYTKELIEAGILFDESALEFTATKKHVLREAKEYMGEATGLHIFVVTTACNMNCIYCQANNGREKPHSYMSIETAEKAVDIALQSPNKCLNFEFQGGEPLLNFQVIKHIVEYAETNKGHHEICYNLVSNLTLVTDKIIEFLNQYKVGVSTSLDGPEHVHNSNRVYGDGSGTFSNVVDSITKVRAAGIRVGAIETTTRHSLSAPEGIVRCYAEMGFDSVFIRPLTQLGKASAGWNQVGYTAEQFLEFYKRAFNELIKLNQQGRYIKEAHASIFLQKMQGTGINYMELRSPCGAGIGQMVYYTDGSVFTCDEGRMFYEMGSDTFKLGTVLNTYKELIENGVCRSVCTSGILESIPGCCDCVYQPYCGVCPVVNYASESDLITKQPRNYRCRIYSGMLDTIFAELQHGDTERTRVLWSWSA